MEIKIIRTPNGIELSQSQYMDKDIEIFKKIGAKGVWTLFNPSEVHHKSNNESVMQVEYSRVTRCLMYLNKSIEQLSSNSGKEHQKELRRALGYLKNNINFSLRYRKYHAILKGYNAANWIADLD